MRPITASDLMNPEVLTVEESLPVPDLAGFLLDNEITGAPVVDRDGRLVGVVSLADVAAVAAEDDAGEDEAGAEDAGEDEMAAGVGPEASDQPTRSGSTADLQVRDIMTPEIYSVAEDATVSEVAMTLLRDHLHRVLVMRDDEVLGIISTSDLLGLLVDVE